MLINIENATQKDVLNNKFTIAIENILRSFAEKKHLVISSKSFFNSIIEEQSGIYSISSKNFASEALSGLREYHAILNQVSFYISVDFTIPDTSFKWVEHGEKYKFVCGPLYFNDSSQLQKTKIVCENPLDSDFFKIIAAFYARNENLSRCSINFNALNGGGGSTKDTFERTIKNDEIAFCIVDNDKSHPRAPYGGTSAHFLGSRTNRSGLVEILDVHEIESLLPLETIEEVLKNLNLMEKKEKSLAFLKEICSIDESVKFYFDHKKGFNLKTALELDNIHGDFWSSILKKINYKYNCECIELKKCECEPSCLNYEGFGDNLLNNTLQYIHKGSLRKYTPDLPPKLHQKWYKLGKNFFSWSCGPYKKSRVS
ncbi:MULTISPECIES: hypothetical protein [Pectobacterium]|uniref:hypothetical protein n=1 Tax=Pectobacterium TaxID=122277 RepID=UPI00052ACDA7|nr:MULTISPECIES: hypothetical protein [Pectobacterium]AIU87102.1 hypothetical protein BCS7_02035 [Pectobacterium odoriferum]MCA5933474.1 hypothetical protein [Pectobacterium versatile]MCA5950535.1 hypothetical protein [Pectobacterium versatile]MCA5954999.1 hypothetical protein [Pectobacterium versatile]MCA6961066.1 hypothetical protein [Pectobacterium odoriferum]